jgi:nicotinamide-nucleotide amidase
VTRVRAQILTIGDELLAGDVVDKNKAFLGQRCRALGIEVVRAASIRDRESEIVAALRESTALGSRDAGISQICLVSGGLGPTTDDLTAAAVARAAGVELVRHAELAARLEAFFASRGRALIETNLKQADLPAGAIVLDNPIGTAAGFALELQASDATTSCWVFSMPGVPREMHKMMREQVEPRLRERFELVAIPRRVFRSLGTGESQLQQQVTPVLEAARARSPGLANMFVHYRARYPEVQLILEATPGETDGIAATAEELAALDEPLREVIGRSFVTVGDGEGPPELVEQLVAELIARGLKIATAESCTGGGIGQAITSVSGSSACFVGGVIAYANEVKIGALGVPVEHLQAHGAVSEPVARAMAEGARTRLGADIGVSTTGIAGPGGGTPDKPVGTVDVAVATAAGTSYKRLRLFGERDTIRQAAVVWALKLVWDELNRPIV